MNVRELIQELLECDMESEVIVSCKVDTYAIEEFQFDVLDKSRLHKEIRLQFELDEQVLIDKKELAELYDESEQLKDLMEGTS